MFRFTIRDVLLVMAIAGIALGWWIDHRKLQIDWDRVKRNEANHREVRHEMEIRFKAERERYIYTLREVAAHGLTPADISYEHP